MFPSGRVVEVGHLLEEGIPAFPEHAPYRHRQTSAAGEPLSFLLELHEHAGTHVDAPCHWSPQGAGRTIDETDPLGLVGPCWVVDVRGSAPGEQLAPDRVAAQVDPGAIVLFRFGWDAHWGEPECYLHDWPGLSGEFARWLVAVGVAAVGTDAPAIDAAGPHGMPAHEVLLGAGIPVIENLCNLGEVDEGGLFVALPLRIAGGSGSPIRPVVVVENHTASQ